MGLSPQLNVIVGANTDQLRAEMVRAQNTIAGFTKSVNSSLNNIGLGIGAYQVSRWALEVVESMAAFQHSMSEVKAITGATGKDLQDLRDSALNLAGAFKAIDISKLETEFGRLGFSTKEILQSTEATINLAAATGENLASSAQIAGSTLRAFQLDAKEMGRVTDVMAGSFNRTALDLTSFSEAIKYVAPVAKAANVSLEETTAMLGTLADAGVKGSMAGTSLRRILTDFSKDGRSATEKLAELARTGITLSDSFDEVGRTAQTSLLLLVEGTKKTDALNESLHHVNGEAKEMARIMQDDLVGDWNKFTAEIDRNVQSGGLLNDMLRETLQILTLIPKYTFQGDAKLLQYLFDTELASGFNKELRLSTELLEKYAKNAGHAAVEVKSLMEQLNPTATQSSALTPEQMRMQGMKQNGSAIPMNIWKQMVFANTGNPGKAGGGSSPIDEAKDLSEAMKMIAKDTGNASDAYKEMFQAQNLVDDEYANFHEAVAPEVQAAIDGIVERQNHLKANTISLQTSLQQAGRMIKSTFTTIAVDIGKALGNLASGVSSNLGGELLGTLGSIAVEVGKMAIGIGIGIGGIKIALESLNPAAAIAAGVALVALGTYFSNQSQAIGGSMGGGGSGGGSSYSRPADGLQVQPLMINITGEFKQSGPDMVASINQAKYQMSRTGGNRS